MSNQEFSKKKEERIREIAKEEVYRETYQIYIVALLGFVIAMIIISTL